MIRQLVIKLFKDYNERRIKKEGNCVDIDQLIDHSKKDIINTFLDNSLKPSTKTLINQQKIKKIKLRNVEREREKNRFQLSQKLQKTNKQKPHDINI